MVSPQLKPRQVEQSNEAYERAVRSLRQWAAPTVRVFMNQRIGIDVFLEQIRELFVEEAEEAGADSVSEIATATGMTGYEVKKVIKLREDRQSDPKHQTARAMSPEGKILGNWCQQSMFVDENGEPKPLKVRGKGASFEQLVRYTLGNVSYDPILAALEDAGAVAMELRDRRDRFVVLKERLFYPSDGFRRLEIGARSARHFQQALCNNLISAQTDDERWPQQEIWTTCLNEENADVFRSRVVEFVREQREHAYQFLSALELELKLGPQTPESIQAGVGLYYFEDQTWSKYEKQPN